MNFPSCDTHRLGGDNGAAAGAVCELGMIMFCASSLPRSARVTFPRRAPGSWTPPIKALTYHYHTAALGKGKLDACRNQKVESIKTYDHGLEKNLWKPKRLFKAKTFFFFLEFRIKSGRVGTPVKFLLHLCPPVRRFALSIGQTKKLELSPEQEVRRNLPMGTLPLLKRAFPHTEQEIK